MFSSLHMLTHLVLGNRWAVLHTPAARQSGIPENDCFMPADEFDSYERYSG